ncbi:2-amino-3-carboxymuconate-6-semialdehyde decarboxylase [Ilyonectria robusta]
MTASHNIVIKAVALAGAGGNLGQQVLAALLNAGFDVTVLVYSGSKPVSYPTQVRVLEVDYESPDSLLDALRGIDAVVSTLGKKTGLQCQFALIDAAATVGVKRFVPSEFGADLQNGKIRAFPTYQIKVQIEEYAEKKARETDLTYTYVYNSLLFEEGLGFGVFGDFSARKVSFFDGGDTAFSFTRLVTAARAVVAVLRNFEATKNRAVRIQDVSITPRELLNAIQSLDPEHHWSPIAVDTGKLVKEAEQELASAKFSPKAFAAFATRATFAPGFAGSYKGDNEVLGIEEMTEEELKNGLKARFF